VWEEKFSEEVDDGNSLIRLLRASVAAGLGVALDS
jgi:hypothetical protein